MRVAYDLWWPVQDNVCKKPIHQYSTRTRTDSMEFKKRAPIVRIHSIVIVCWHAVSFGTFHLKWSTPINALINIGKQIHWTFCWITYRFIGFQLRILTLHAKKTKTKQPKSSNRWWTGIKFKMYGSRPRHRLAHIFSEICIDCIFSIG